ncbi:MAG: C25 family cysteine peptidase [Candidatus Eisenbacteria bacterium]|nr:C25 family cysteine peptidase [Candidatus Eisenbacteria bacterium]
MKTHLRLVVTLGLFVLGAAFPEGSAFAKLAAGIQILKSDESGVTLEVVVDTFEVTSITLDGRTFHLVELADFLTTEDEGLPQLPFTSCLIAIPFASTPRLNVLTNETATRSGVVPVPVSRAFIRGGEFPTPVREFAIDESFYHGTAPFPSEVARLGEPATLRHQRVVPVRLFPFQYYPASGLLVYSRRLVVRVDFGSSSEPRRVNLEPAPSFELYSEGLYQGLLLNYEDARPWRMKPQSRQGETVFPVSQAVQEYKIAIDSSSVYKVSYSSIQGLSTAYPLDQVRLFEKFYEEDDPSPFKQVNVPIHIVDADSNGYFDGDDYFVFYGLSFRDRFPTDVFEARYSYDNVYWLTVGDSPGSFVSERDSWRSSSSPQQPSSFLHVQQFEKDSLYMNVPPRENMDYYFWKQPTAHDIRIPFSVYSPDTTKAWRIRARYQGFIPSLHYVTMILENSRGKADTLFNEAQFGPSTALFKAEATLDTGFSIPDTMLASGNNTFRYIGERLDSGVKVTGSGAYFDWFEVSYYKTFAASGGVLVFNSGTLSGELEFTLTGFPSPGILLYDVTDSLNPVLLTVHDSQITSEASGYSLVFRDSIGVYPKRYAAITTGALPNVPSIAPDTPSSLATSGASKDYFIVAYDAFAPLTAPLASHRESQGHNVELAKLTDVFDEFNGGRRSPIAIRRYMRYAFSSWGTPLFLLLVGDASEDYKGVASRSDTDFVPTYLMFSPVAGPSGKELVGNEQWFVTALDGVEDDYPDMYVGRLTVGSSEEATALVQKIINYEAFSTTEDFRGRGLFVADDSYSSADMANDRLSTSERIFKSISDEARRIVNASPAAPSFAADTFYLGTFLDSVPSYPKPQSVPLADMIEYVRTEVKPKFLSSLSTGGLFVNYQGHGSQIVLAHERLFYSWVYDDDVPSVLNYNKPWVFTAFSCHIGDFDRETEKSQGDCLAEKLLLLPTRGAIATFSSDAYENLPSNIRADMNVVLFDAFFGSPPTADLRGKRGARWILGEIITSGKIRFLSGDYLNKQSVRTYALLGDPGLRMDALPPQFVVSLNDSLLVDGSSVYVESSDDSARIGAYVSDEVAVDETSVWIEESGTEGRGIIPRSEYAVTALADTIAGASRKFYLYWPTVLRPATYDITLHATDVNGRETEFVLKVELTTTFSVGGRTIREGDWVPSNIAASALVSSPIVLSQDEMEFFVNSAAVVTSKQQIDGVGRTWRLEAELFLPEGGDTLTVKVGGIERRVTVNVTAEFNLMNVFCYPSPFAEVTSFNYELTGVLQKVSIEIFTVSGRKILDLQGDARVGYNSVIWDGRDAEGNRIANGLYLYRLTVTDVQGKRDSFLGKVVKVE